MDHLGDGAVPGAANDGRQGGLWEGSTVNLKEQRAGAGRCGHGCYPVEAMPVDGGRVARCLGCGLCGPTRASARGALAALREPGAPEAETGRRHLRLMGA